MVARLMDWIKPESFYLIDTHQSRHWGDAETYKFVRSEVVPALRQLPVFDITNVAEYFYLSGDEYDDAKAFPNIIPPFPSCWMEFDYPTHRMSPRGTIERTTDKAPKKMGTIVDADRTDDGWSITLTFIWGYDETIQVMQSWTISETADHDGNATQSETISSSDPNITDEQVTEICSVARGLYGPVFLALSFLHCKNVIVTDQSGIYPSRQARREAQRRNDPPLVTYKTLQIEPMKKVLATEGGIATNGMKKALHICRGHFAEYGDEYGKGKLFGKYEGRFWMPAHVRGSAESGEVIKDYNVKAPRKDAA